MNLSILIPVKDDTRIVNCINSIDEEVEVVVVMNDPSDEIIDIVSKLQVKSVFLPEANLSKAYNAGIEASKYDKILLMDSDCIFEKGTIRKLYNGALNSKLSKGRVVFTYDSLQSKIVSKVREFTTSDYCNAFSPPLIIDRSLKNELGYFFNPALIWEEDLDFNARIAMKRIRIHWNKGAVIYHPPLRIKNDLKAAFNYGRGHGIGINEGIFQEESLKERVRRLKKSYKIIKEKKGILECFYYRIWNFQYQKGIREERKGI